MTIKNCLRCGIEKEVEARGLCRPCYQQEPDIKVKRLEYRNRPEVKVRIKEYERSPDYRTRKNAYWKKYNAEHPEAAEKARQRAKKYYATHKEQLKAYNKEYYSRPENKEKQRLYHREYNARPEVIAREKKQYSHNPNPVTMFFEQYNKNVSWQRDGIEMMSSIFAEVTCDLKGEAKCKMQEKIMAVANEKIRKPKEWRD